MSDVIITTELQGITDAIKTLEQFKSKFGDLEKASKKSILQGVSDNFKTLGKSLDNAGEKLTKFGKTASIAITAPLAAAATATIKFASEANESESLFRTSMGKMADSAEAWSKDLRKNLGLNEFELRKQVGTFDTMFKSMGFSEKAAYGMSTSLIELSGDMASFFNLEPAAAFDKLKAGIVGESEPLKALGILVNETTIKQTALNHGIIKFGEEMSETQKVQARYITILEQTSTAQGDLAATLDSPANKLRVLQSEAVQLATDFGYQLLPAYVEILDIGKTFLVYVQESIDWFKSLDPVVKENAISFALLTAAVGPTLLAFGTAVKVAGSLTTTIGLLATPMGLVVGAIAGLVTAGVLLYKNWEQVKNYSELAWSATKIVVLESIAAITDALAFASGWIPGIGKEMEAASKHIHALITDEHVKQTKINAEIQKQAAIGSAKETGDEVIKQSKEVSGKVKLTEQEIREAAKETSRVRIAETAKSSADVQASLRLVSSEAEVNAKATIEQIKNITNASAEEKVKMLRIALDTYGGLGNEGKAASALIRKEISNLTNHQSTEADKWREKWKQLFSVDFKQMVYDAMSSMKSAFSSSIVEMVNKGKSLSSGISDIFSKVKEIIVGKLAEIVATAAFSQVFGGGAVGGGGAGGAGGGGAAGAIAGGATAAVGAGLATGGISVGAAAAVLGGLYLYNAFKSSDRAPTQEDIDREASKAKHETLHTARANTLGEFNINDPNADQTTVNRYNENVLRSLPDLIKGRPGYYTPEIIENMFISDKNFLSRPESQRPQSLVKAREELYKSLRDGINLRITDYSVGDIDKKTFELSKPVWEAARYFEFISPRLANSGGRVKDWPKYAMGGDFITTGPQLMLVGEAGQERVSVKPAGTFGGGSGGGTTNLNFNAPILFDAISARQFAKFQNRYSLGR